VTPVKKVFQYGDHTVTIETGEIARQATSAVMISMGDTVVMVTAVGMKEAIEGRDFFPLTVNYQERTYSAGKIPGGFFKREGRPSEKETLTSRLIDRPLRPLFPKGFTNEVQVIATVVSLDAQIDPDITAMLGASAALALSAGVLVALGSPGNAAARDPDHRLGQLAEVGVGIGEDVALAVPPLLRGEQVTLGAADPGQLVDVEDPHASRRR